MEDFEPWQGGKGIVRKLPCRDWGYEVEVTEVPPTNDSIKVGHTTTFQPEWLRPVETPADVVNDAPHYGGKDNPYEVIKVAEAWGLDKDAYLFNVLKYIGRADKKGASLQDHKKARYYLDRKIKNLENK